MLLQISHRIVSAWSRRNIIPKGSAEAYIYGVQLLLSTVINVCCIALLSYCMGHPFSWIPFLIGFVPLRITGGGFHAKTPSKCTLSFCGSYFICMIFLNTVSRQGMHLAVLINSILTIITLYFFLQFRQVTSR